MLKVNDSALVYVQGGYSWGHFDVNLSNVGAPPGFPDGSVYDWNSSGFSIGGGIEAPVTDNMTIDLNYRFTQYQAHDLSPAIGDLIGSAIPDDILTVTPSVHTVRIAAKWKFNVGG